MRLNNEIALHVVSLSVVNIRNTRTTFFKLQADTDEFDFEMLSF